MGRLFAGLCQVGAWGCFDEFNRLEERILSAVSSQILTIQRSLQIYSKLVELLGRPVKLHPNVGIFVTMNPSYAGRSNLPDNLKQLFRAVAMVVPDRNLIAQVGKRSEWIYCALLARLRLKLPPRATLVEKLTVSLSLTRFARVLNHGTSRFALGAGDAVFPGRDLLGGAQQQDCFVVPALRGAAE